MHGGRIIASRRIIGWRIAHCVFEGGLFYEKYKNMLVRMLQE